MRYYKGRKKNKNNQEYRTLEIEIEIIGKMNLKIIMDNESSINIIIKSAMNYLKLKKIHKTI